MSADESTHHESRGIPAFLTVVVCSIVALGLTVGLANLLGGSESTEVESGEVGHGAEGAGDEGDHDEDPGEDASGLPPLGEVTTDGGERLLELVELGSGETYAAVYLLESTNEGPAPRLELYRDGGSLREEASVPRDQGILEESVLIIEAGEDPVTCNRLSIEGEDADWLCNIAGPSGLSSDLFTGRAAYLARADEVEVTEREIAGFDAECFSVASDGFSADPAELCYRDDGVALSLTNQNITLELSELSDDVPDDVFELPGELATPAGDADADVADDHTDADADADGDDVHADESDDDSDDDHSDDANSDDEDHSDDE